jgi:hypothetical protein
MKPEAGWYGYATLTETFVYEPTHAQTIQPSQDFCFCKMSPMVFIGLLNKGLFSL